MEGNRQKEVAMSEASAGPTVSDQARELIGTVTYSHVSEPISLRHIHEYVAATGGDPADWPDTSDSGTPLAAPPLFFHAACRPVVAQSQLDEDGQYIFLGVTGVTGHTLAGGNKYEVIAPVYVGDVLTTSERLVSIDEREGRSGQMAITTTETTYTNQRGEIVARYRHVIIFR
jgi:acyl dehydratase